MRSCQASTIGALCGRPAEFVQAMPRVKGKHHPGRRYLCPTCARKQQERGAGKADIRPIGPE